MGQLSPYLFFEGNCREAITFYKSCIKGELIIMTYEDGGVPCSEALKGKIMHAYLHKGNLTLMASDTDNESITIGNNVQIGIGCESLSEIESLFKSLSENIL